MHSPSFKIHSHTEKYPLHRPHKLKEKSIITTTKKAALQANKPVQKHRPTSQQKLILNLRSKNSENELPTSMLPKK